MPNDKEYYKGKYGMGIELTEGEQLILIKENLQRVKQQQDGGTSGVIPFKHRSNEE